MRILFLCSDNECRSLTFEWWMNENHPEHEVRSAGLESHGHFVLMQLMKWADRIYVMEEKHLKDITWNFHDHLPKTKMIGVPDRYKPRDPRLIEIIEDWYRKEDW